MQQYVATHSLYANITISPSNVRAQTECIQLRDKGTRKLPNPEVHISNTLGGVEMHTEACVVKTTTSEDPLGAAER